tara:strand:- start:5066 stop:7525 length:2460 start_codon:yes stop_codon:yes gene_type:complete
MMTTNNSLYSDVVETQPLLINPKKKKKKTPPKLVAKLFEDDDGLGIERTSSSSSSSSRRMMGVSTNKVVVACVFCVAAMTTILACAWTTTTTNNNNDLLTTFLRKRQSLFREGVGKESNDVAAAKDLDDDDEDNAIETTTTKSETKHQVEPELAFHTEDEIASVIAAVVEGDEKKTNEREEEKKRRRSRMKTSLTEKETTTTTTTREEEPSRMGMTEQYDGLDREGGVDERSKDALTNRGESTKESISSMDAATSTSDVDEEDKDDQEDEAEEQSQAEEKSRAWELSTYLNVQPDSEKSAESLVALIASAGGDERELEKYVKVVEPIDPSQWPVNIDKAMYALKSIFILKSREMAESQLEAKLGDFFVDDEMEDGIATRNRRSLKSEPAEEGGKLGYFDMGKFIEDAMNGRVREKTNDDDDDDDNDYDSITETSRSKVGFGDLEASLAEADDNKASLDNQAAVGALGYFEFKDFVRDAVSAHPTMTEDDDSEDFTSNWESVGIKLGEDRREETPRLGKSIEEPSKSNESLKELGLTADDVKFLYKAYKKEKKEKENLEDDLEKINKNTVEDDNEDDEAMTSAKAWNLNHLRGMGWFEALIDRDKETGKLSSKWWQTEKIPELGKLFSHVYRWQLAKDAKDEKALILDAAGLLDTSNLAVPMDAIRVISAHASNDFDVMFLSNLGTKDPIFETFPDSSGNVIEIRKWQGTQDATNANAYIVSAQFVHKIFDFILSSDMNAPKESLENWLGRVVCGAKEQQPQQDDSGETSSVVSLESNVDESLSEESTLAKKPVVGKHVFNCYSATGVQVKPTTSNASSK